MKASLHAFFMPTRFSSDGTRRAAAQIADDLEVSFAVIPIEEAFQRELDATRAMLGEGGPLTELTRSRTSRRASAAGACGTGRTPAARCSCRRAT